MERSWWRSTAWWIAAELGYAMDDLRTRRPDQVATASGWMRLRGIVGWPRRQDRGRVANAAGHAADDGVDFAEEQVAGGPASRLRRR